MPDDLGFHASVAGGLATCFERAARVDARAIQIFVKNQRQWAARPLAPEDVAAFRRARAAGPVRTAVAHATYLVNLAARDPAILERSIATYAEELRRADALGLAGVVVHPGSAADGREAGVERIARALESALARAPGGRPILEGMPGCGAQVGGRFEDLRAILDRLPAPLAARVGVCLDTCHAHAAGYAIGRRRDLEDTLVEFDAIVGLRRLAVLHLNDSKGARGSRLDRHTNLGEGTIGRACFEAIVNDPRLAAVPKILETPQEGDAHERDLRLLRAMKRGERRHGVPGGKRRPVRGG